MLLSFLLPAIQLIQNVTFLHPSLILLSNHTHVRSEGMSLLNSCAASFAFPRLSLIRSHILFSCFSLSLSSCSPMIPLFMYTHCLSLSHCVSQPSQFPKFPASYADAWISLWYCYACCERTEKRDREGRAETDRRTVIWWMKEIHSQIPCPFILITRSVSSFRQLEPQHA